jgi:hypothetical protein
MSKKIKDYLNQSGAYKDISPRRELWQDIANEYNSKLVIKHDSSNALEFHQMKIPYRGIEIEIVESDIKPLKFEFSYNSNEIFELILGFEDSIEKILKKLGKKDVEIGIKDFDNHYLIQTNDSFITKSILNNIIVEKIMNHNIYSISITTEKQSYNGNYICAVSRFVEEKSKLQDLIFMHKLIIDQLYKTKVIK